MLFTFSVLSFRYSTEELFSDRRETLAGLGLCLSGPLPSLVSLVMELSSVHRPDTSPGAVGRQPSALSPIQGSFTAKSCLIQGHCLPGVGTPSE